MIYSWQCRLCMNSEQERRLWPFICMLRYYSSASRLNEWSCQNNLGCRHSTASRGRNTWRLNRWGVPNELDVEILNSEQLSPFVVTQSQAEVIMPG